MEINPNDKSWKDLCNIAQKQGFYLYEGGNHTKVKTLKGEFVTIVPRHNRIDKNLAKNILKDMKRSGADIKIRR